MTQDVRSELTRLSDHWSNALQQGNLDLALEIATQGYSVARTLDDHVEIMMFLGFVRHAADSLFDSASKRKSKPQSTDNVCSFCLQEKSIVLRGVRAAICEDCIAMAKVAS